MLAHVAGVPVEELLALLLGTGTGAWLALRSAFGARLRRLAAGLRRAGPRRRRS